MTIATVPAWRPFDQSLDLTPQSLESYLAVSGWVRGRRGTAYGIWHNETFAARLRLPYDKTYDDFELRFAEAIAAVSAVTGLSGEALQLEVASARSDILFLRADQFTADGSIPLTEGQSLLNGVHKLLYAAACSAVRPKAAHRGKRPSSASDFMKDDVRLGHTLRGSYVLTIFARLTDDLPGGEEVDGPGPSRSIDPGGRDDGETVAPFARQVMDTLANGITAVTNAVGASPRYTLDEAIDEGASVEMIQSIDAMTHLQGVRALDLNFKWSRAIEAREAGARPERVIVDRETVEAVRQFVPSMERRREPEGDSVAGQVVRLERGVGDDEGVVIVDGLVGKDRRKVRMKLSGAAYRTAVASHANHAPVVASGIFDIIKRSWWLKDPVIR